MNDYPIVALSCSAGGLDALIKVLGPLPASLPAAVLILQHMPPDVSSHLPVILGRSTDLPVQWAGMATRSGPGGRWSLPPGSTP